MSSQSYPKHMLQSIKVLEKVCRNKDILELSQDGPEWTNALNDCISLSKWVARKSQTARFLEQDDWERFMDVICSESKAPEMLPEALSVLIVPLRSETVLSLVSNSTQFDDCFMSLAHLAEFVENDHRSGSYLGEALWKELRTVVKQNSLVVEALNPVPRLQNETNIPAFKEQVLNMPLEDKRKLYACKTNFVTLSNIPPWCDLASRTGVGPEEDPIYPVHCGMNEKISLFEGDITRLEIDAIVNSTNSALRATDGVDVAIHRAAGPVLAEECRGLNGLEPGTAKITGGYLLPAKYVIHTAGPVFKDVEILQSCYKHCLDLMLENGLRSVAFPCISTGVCCYPNQTAAIMALKTVRDFLQVEGNLHRVDRIIFCVYVPLDASVYKELLPVYFPV